jgi:hypothetical protein
MGEHLSQTIQANEQVPITTRDNLAQQLVRYKEVNPQMFPHMGKDAYKGERVAPSIEIYRTQLHQMLHYPTEFDDLGARQAISQYILAFDNHGSSPRDFPFWWSTHLLMFGEVIMGKCPFNKILGHNLIFSEYLSTKKQRDSYPDTRIGTRNGSNEGGKMKKSYPKKEQKEQTPFGKFINDNRKGQLCNKCSFGWVEPGHTSSTCSQYKSRYTPKGGKNK